MSLSRCRTLGLFVVVLILVSAPAQAQESSRSAWQYRWDEHPEVRAGRALRLEFRARVQFDSIRTGGPEGSGAGSGWGLRRVGMRGDLFRSVEFEVDYDLDDRVSGWRDAFVNVHRAGALQVQAGQFKVPFSQDELTSRATLDFAYRSRAADLLAPGRDRGVMVHGELVGRRIGYEAGVFEHDGENARVNNPERTRAGRTTAVRVTAQPFRNTPTIFEDVRVGLAGTASQVAEGLPSIRGRSALGESFYDAVYWTAGARKRLALEARWRPGPMSIKTEYLRLSDERLGQDVDGGDLPPIVGVGWFVSATWAVTGEAKADGVGTPRRPVTAGGPGAIEVAVRFEGIRFSSPGSTEAPSSSPRAATIVGREQRLVTMGVTWHPVRWGRVLWNVVRQDDLAPGDVPALRRVWLHIVRFQMSL